MDEAKNVIAGLTSKDAAAACALAERIAGESRESDRWYPMLEDFAALLRHRNSLVRNRAIAILAANARWAEAGRFDAFLEELLGRVTDEKPITARQCVKALPELARGLPELAPRIREALEKADLSRYNDNMRPLITKDIIAALRETEALL